MTDDDARTILNTARATCMRLADLQVEPVDYLKLAMSRHVEHPRDAERRELSERDARWAREHAAEAEDTAHSTEAWLCERLATERAFVLECVGQALGEALRKERDIAKRELGSEIRSLRLELAALDDTISELRKATSSNRSGEVVDITPARRAN